MSDKDLENDVTELDALTFQLNLTSRQRLKKLLSRYELTVPQFMALNCLQQQQDACSMSEIADSTLQVSATMTGIINRLEENGLVKRERDHTDRRTLRVRITPRGDKLIEAICKIQQAYLYHFFDGLSPAERRTAIDLAKRYLEAMTKVDPSEGKR